MMGSPESTACDFSTSWELRKVNAFLSLEEEVSRTPSCLPRFVFLSRLMECSGWYLLALMDLVWEKGKLWDSYFPAGPRVVTGIGCCLLDIEVST